jgi:dephospho-CoA kinase
MSRLVIGLTGGVASGKSAIAQHFEQLGVPVLDADQVSRDVVAPPSPALDEIVQTFGADSLLPDGTLDRRRMRERIFGDASAKQTLEGILHPHMARRMSAWCDMQTSPYCILSIAILIETGMRKLVQRVLAVDVPVETQLARLVQRDGITKTLAHDMIASQASRETRLAAADDVIVNTGTLEQSRAQVAKLHQKYQALEV